MKINWREFMSAMLYMIGLAWFCFLLSVLVCSFSFPWWVGASALAALVISGALFVSAEAK